MENFPNLDKNTKNVADTSSMDLKERKTKEKKKQKNRLILAL